MTALSLRSIRQSSRFDLISTHIPCELSMNVACAAPREIASIPTAPEPAQRSRKRLPWIRGAMTLNRVSRRRSDVGRTSSDGGLFRFRPRNFPAMILKIGYRRSTKGHELTRNAVRVVSCDARGSYLVDSLFGAAAAPCNLRNLRMFVYPTAANPNRASDRTRSIIPAVSGDFSPFAR